MDPLKVQKAVTAHAANLFERLDGLKGSGRAVTTYASAGRDIDWWVKAYFGGQRKRLNSFLRLYGLVPAHFAHAVQAERMAGTVEHPATSYDAPAVIQILEQKAGLCGHEWLCGNLLASAYEAIEALLAPVSNDAVQKTDILAEFLVHLNQRLAKVAMPTIILALNVARIGAETAAESGEARFKKFTRSLGEPDIQVQFWHAYPVVQRNLRVMTAVCREACKEAIERILSDKELIKRSFALGDDARLNSIAWQAGDPHCRGRAVAVLRFGGRRIVYKPKDMSVYSAYAAFINWYASVGGASAPSMYGVLDRGDYGYVDYIEAIACTAQAEAERYYERVGALLCIYWILGGCDLHFENLIASGPNPFPIDLDSLFDKQLRYPARLIYQARFAQCHRELLFKTYVLPNRILGPNGVYDISALGAAGQQTADVSVYKAVNAGRDDMRLALVPGAIPVKQNMPVISGGAALPSSFIDHILRGYRSAASTLVRHSAFLLGKDSPLDLFAKVRTRWVPRATQEYATLLRSCAHPNMQKDALECDMLMGGRLTDFQQSPQLTALIKSEIRDLWNHDVPYFWTTPESRSLFDSVGQEINGFFCEDGLTAAKRRLEALPVYKDAHEAIIRATLECTTIKASGSTKVSGKEVHVDGSASPDMILKLATEVGERVLASVHYVEAMPFCYGKTPLGTLGYNATLLPPTFYEGMPGIGVFFACLHKLSRDERHLRVAQGSRKLTRALMDDPGQFKSCGAYDGFASILYADMLLADLLGQRFDVPSPSLKHLARLINTDGAYDIISGAAGALIVALRLFERIGDPSALEAARSAAEKLKTARVKTGSAIAWPTIGLGAERYAGGLAHGVSGIAWALSEWATQTGDDSCKETVAGALAYEDSLFDANVGSWRDVRKEGSYSCGWCHGAVGIGLAASAMQGYISRNASDSIVSRAKRATWESRCHSHCLCHGTLGNAELYRTSGDHEKTRFLVDKAIAEYARRGDWACGHAEGITVPGLLCGLSGIGLGLLRHLDPLGIPNILLLEGKT